MVGIPKGTHRRSDTKMVQDTYNRDWTLGQFLAMRNGSTAKRIDTHNIWAGLLEDNGKLEVTA